MLSKSLYVIATAIPKITSKFLELGPSHPRPHTGVDFAIPVGTKLRAIGEGVVGNIVNYGDKNVGKGVFVRLDNGMKVLYGHLSEVTVKTGDKVSVGDIVGLSGNTGHSTGPHLHFQAYDTAGKLIDPTNMAQGVFEKLSSGSSGSWGEPGLLDKINPLKGIEDQIIILNAKIDAFNDKLSYVLHPTKLIDPAWHMIVNGSYVVCVTCTFGGLVLGLIGYKKGYKIAIISGFTYYAIQIFNSVIGG